LRRFAVVTTHGGRKNAATVGVLLEIQTPSLLPELVQRLTATGCVTRAIDDRVCHVVHPAAIDAAEEWQEVHFFLRAWQARNGGVEVILRPDAIRRPAKRRR
jgi:hypothetical protein